MERYKEDDGHGRPGQQRNEAGSELYDRMAGLWDDIASVWGSERGQAYVGEKHEMIERGEGEVKCRRNGEVNRFDCRSWQPPASPILIAKLPSKPNP